MSQEIDHLRQEIERQKKHNKLLAASLRHEKARREEVQRAAADLEKQLDLVKKTACQPCGVIAARLVKVERERDEWKERSDSFERALFSPRRIEL